MRQRLGGSLALSRGQPIAFIHMMTNTNIINCVSFSISHWTQTVLHTFCAINHLQREYSNCGRIMVFDVFYQSLLLMVLTEKWQEYYLFI